LTTVLQLCNPAAGETNWTAALNNNRTVLDSFFQAGPLLKPQYGGSGINASAAANGRLLIGNGTGFTLNPLTGTTNQVTVTNGAGTVTLSTPQDIATTSTPQFAATLTRINRFTQGTAPTCLDVLGVNVCPGALAIGSDSALRLRVAPGIAAGTRSLTVTFNTSWAAAPACVASWNGTASYGYYIYAVAPSTTTAVLSLGGPHGSSPSWSPADQASLLCFGVQ